MPQSEYSCNRNGIFPGQSDFHFVAHAFDEISEPYSGLREQMMTSPGHEEESVEFIQKLWRLAGFVSKSFLFGPLNFALKGILVQSPKKLLQAPS